MSAARYLVTDVGGTNTRVSLTLGTRLLENTTEIFQNRGAGSLEIILSQYLARQSKPDIDGICVAVAGPVAQDTAEMTNISWTIDLDQLKKVSGAPTAGLLNDLQAQGYALSSLEDANVKHLFGPETANRDQRMLVCGIGTGFNIAQFIPTSYGSIVPPAEAGHTRIPVRTELERWIVDQIMDDKGFASVEHILSGKGLTLLNSYICPEVPRTPQEVIRDAHNDPRARDVVDCMIGFAGSIFGDLALTTLPIGGIYLIGGVSRAIAPFIHSDNYGAAFCDKGRFSDFNQKFATRIVVDDFAALKGCANYLAQG
jgi:glucokinase